MPAQPITVLARKEVCRNAVFTVSLDHIRDQAGNEVVDYLNVRPINRSTAQITGIAVLPVVDNRIGLIRIYRHPLGQYGWEVPRGFIDRGETAASAAVRELSEETGLAVSAGGLQPLGMLAPDPGLLDARILLYMAHCGAAQVRGAERELGHGELRFFSTTDIRDLMDLGEITDPCTLVCCLKFMLPNKIPGGEIAPPTKI